MTMPIEAGGQRHQSYESTSRYFLSDPCRRLEGVFSFGPFLVPLGAIPNAEPTSCNAMACKGSTAKGPTWTRMVIEENEKGLTQETSECAKPRPRAKGGLRQHHKMRGIPRAPRFERPEPRNHVGALCDDRIVVAGSGGTRTCAWHTS